MKEKKFFFVADCCELSIIVPSLPLNSVFFLPDIPSGAQINYARKPVMGMPDDGENIDGGLGLGELAGLTISNEADPVSYDVSC